MNFNAFRVLLPIIDLSSFVLPTTTTIFTTIPSTFIPTTVQTTISITTVSFVEIDVKYVKIFKIEDFCLFDMESIQQRMKSRRT